MIKAKFFVKSNMRCAQGGNTPPFCIVTLAAVIGPGNEAWSKNTPDGEIKMTITNQLAADELEAGKTFMLTFEAQE